MKKLRFLLPVFLAALQLHAQVPALSSYPAAKATAFLDFDGQLVQGTGWNGVGILNLAPANLTEKQITEVFNRVAEDYRPFNINITTDSTVYWAAPNNKRIRIILTTTYQWYGRAGGISFIGSFIWGDNTPAFVFTELLGFSAKNVGEAASHEIGHTLGLRHQSAYDGNCRKLTEYNPGNGEGEIGWAPIMGVSYYRNFTLWNNGANPFGCTFYQDDLGIITGSMNGFGFRTDDHSNNTTGATPLKFNSNRFTATGIIEKISDRDLFRFTMPGRLPFHLDALPFSITSGSDGSDLDMQVDILNGAEEVVGSYNPASLLGISIDTVLNAGTYFIRVQGRGNIYAPEYASLGSYTISAAMLSKFTQPLRKLELKGSAAHGRHDLTWIVESEAGVTSQQLQVSDDGRNFHPLVDPATVDREYKYDVSISQNRTYRLMVVLSNGRTYYSNLVSLGPVKTGRPELNTHLISTSLQVRSSGEWDYQISDYQGRIVARGHVRAGIQYVNTSHFASGMYVLTFTDGRQSASEKLLKP